MDIGESWSFCKFPDFDFSTGRRCCPEWAIGPRNASVRKPAMRFAFETKHEEPGTARDRNSIVCGDVTERLQGWSNRPGYKFVIAVSEQFAFGFFAASGF